MTAEDLKRLKEALQLLDQVVAMAPVNRQVHIQTQLAVKLLSEHLDACETKPDETKPDETKP